MTIESAFRRIPGRRLAVRTAFDLPLALFSLSAVIGVWAAYDRQLAWSRLGLIVGGIVLYYALSTARAAGKGVGWLPPVLGAALALYFLDTHDWDAYPAKLAALTRLGQGIQVGLLVRLGPRLNSNEVGGILAMIVPFAALSVSGAWGAVRHRPGPCLPGHWLCLGTALVVLALVLFGLLMTTSRGAWVALAVALLIAGWWTVTTRLVRHRRARQAWILNGVLVAALACGVGAAAMWSNDLFTIPAALPGPDTWSSRLEFQRNSLILVRDYPFTGAGLGGFQMLYSTYVLLIHVGYVAHSHNLFLNVAIDQGLPGLLALGWAWLLFARGVWRSRPQPAAGRVAGSILPEMGAAALALVVVLVHGLADNALYGTPGAVLLFLPLSFAVPVAGHAGLARPAAEPRQRGRAVGWTAGIVLIAVPAVVWAGPLAATVYSNLGAVHQGQAELSVYRWPEWPLQDAVRRAVDLSRPAAEFRQALALDPGNATANRRLGMIELSLGNYAAALEHLQAAYAVEPWSVTTRQLLGEALIVNGRQDEGRALWRGLGDAQGQLAARTFWYEHIGDEQRAGWLRQAANSR